MDPQSPRSLTEIAKQIPAEPDHVCYAYTHPPKTAGSPVLQPSSLLELVTVQLQQVNNPAPATIHGEEAAAFSRLAHFASSFLSPLPAGPSLLKDVKSSHSRHIATSALDHLTSASCTPFDDDVLLAIIPYAAGSSDLPGNVGTDVVPKILSRQFSRRSKSDFIVSVLLETAIRPHLTSWSSSRLTATGRVAAYENMASRSAPVDLKTTPPWAGEGSAMVPLFQWALNESDVR